MFRKFYFRRCFIRFPADLNVLPAERRTVGTSFAIKSSAMDFFDLFIIYLACGAPFGVYYFVDHRDRSNRVFFKSLLVALFWFAAAFQLLRKHFAKGMTRAGRSGQLSFRDDEILETKKRLEAVLIKDKAGATVFEVREVLDRYTGLTCAAFDRDQQTAPDDEFFRMAGNENAPLAARCHQRRNRKLLFFHQTLAGRDFLKTISGYVSRFPDDPEIGKISLKLVRLLRDEETEKRLKLIVGGRLQSRDQTSVPETEKEIWINELQQPSTARPLQMSMNSAGAKIRLPVKD